MVWLLTFVMAGRLMIWGLWNRFCVGNSSVCGFSAMLKVSFATLWLAFKFVFPIFAVLFALHLSWLPSTFDRLGEPLIFSLQVYLFFSFYFAIVAFLLSVAPHYLLFAFFRLANVVACGAIRVRDKLSWEITEQQLNLMLSISQSIFSPILALVAAIFIHFGGLWILGGDEGYRFLFSDCYAYADNLSRKVFFNKNIFDLIDGTGQKRSDFSIATVDSINFILTGQVCEGSRISKLCSSSSAYSQRIYQLLHRISNAVEKNTGLACAETFSSRNNLQAKQYSVSYETNRKISASCISDPYEIENLIVTPESFYPYEIDPADQDSVKLWQSVLRGKTVLLLGTTSYPVGDEVDDRVCGSGYDRVYDNIGDRTEKRRKKTAERLDESGSSSIVQRFFLINSRLIINCYVKNNQVPIIERKKQKNRKKTEHKKKLNSFTIHNKSRTVKIILLICSELFFFKEEIKEEILKEKRKNKEQKIIILVAANDYWFSENIVELLSAFPMSLATETQITTIYVSTNRRMIIAPKEKDVEEITIIK